MTRTPTHISTHQPTSTGNINPHQSANLVPASADAKEEASRDGEACRMWVADLEDEVREILDQGCGDPRDSSRCNEDIVVTVTEVSPFLCA